jgi:hypothetical protein
MLHTGATAAPFEMDVLETDDLRLLYFDPFQTYLLPHVVKYIRLYFTGQQDTGNHAKQ